MQRFRPFRRVLFTPVELLNEASVLLFWFCPRTVNLSDLVVNVTKSTLRTPQSIPIGNSYDVVGPTSLTASTGQDA